MKNVKISDVQSKEISALEFLMIDSVLFIYLFYLCIYFFATQLWFILD